MALSCRISLALALFSACALADRELLSTTDVGQTSIAWLAALGTGSAPLDLSDPRVAPNTTATDAEQVCSAAGCSAAAPVVDLGKLV